MFKTIYEDDLFLIKLERLSSSNLKQDFILYLTEKSYYRHKETTFGYLNNIFIYIAKNYPDYDIKKIMIFLFRKSPHLLK